MGGLHGIVHLSGKPYFGQGMSGNFILKILNEPWHGHSPAMSGYRVKQHTPVLNELREGLKKQKIGDGTG